MLRASLFSANAKGGTTSVVGRIVIADDETVIRMGVRCILEEAGYAVVGEASSGDEVVAMVRDAVPDLVVLDIRMPGPDGIEVARRLRTEAPVPVVFLTAYGDRTLAAAAAEVGAYGYVMKPVQEAELLAAVAVAAARAGDAAAARAALETRKLVERAKGIMMHRLGLTADEAYRLLQRRSRNSRKAMRAIAEDVLSADAVFHPGGATRETGRTSP
ncbi:MAG TPA: response regulator [bacterium]|nr:response regulator [bacterium]